MSTNTKALDDVHKKLLDFILSHQRSTRTDHDRVTMRELQGEYDRQKVKSLKDFQDNGGPELARHLGVGKIKESKQLTVESKETNDYAQSALARSVLDHPVSRHFGLEYHPEQSSSDFHIFQSDGNRDHHAVLVHEPGKGFVTATVYGRNGKVEHEAMVDTKQGIHHSIHQAFSGHHESANESLEETLAYPFTSGETVTDSKGNVGKIHRHNLGTFIVKWKNGSRTLHDQVSGKQWNAAGLGDDRTVKLKEGDSDLIDESAPPDMEDWVKKNKARFVGEYGEKKGHEVLYATAWKLHNKKLHETSSTETTPFHVQQVGRTSHSVPVKKGDHVVVRAGGDYWRGHVLTPGHDQTFGSNRSSASAHQVIPDPSYHNKLGSKPIAVHPLHIVRIDEATDEELAHQRSMAAPYHDEFRNAIEQHPILSHVFGDRAHKDDQQIKHNKFTDYTMNHSGPDGRIAQAGTRIDAMYPNVHGNSLSGSHYIVDHQVQPSNGGKSKHRVTISGTHSALADRIVGTGESTNAKDALDNAHRAYLANHSAHKFHLYKKLLPHLNRVAK